jgi:hypothetical protein
MRTETPIVKQINSVEKKLFFKISYKYLHFMKGYKIIGTKNYWDVV